MAEKFNTKSFDLLIPFSNDPSEDAKEWLGAAEILFNNALKGGIDIPLVVMTIKGKLKGDALNLVNGVAADKDWMINVRKKIMCDEIQILKWKTFLSSYKQSGVSILEFMQVMRNVMFRVYEIPAEKDIVMQIILGLEEFWKIRLTMVNFTTYDSMRNEVIRLNAFGIGPSVTPQPSNQPQTQPIDGNALAAQKKNGPRCHRCHRTGHLIAKCYAKTDVKGNTLPPIGNKSNPKYVLSISLAAFNSSASPTYKIIVNGRKIIAIIDTGATVTLVKSIKGKCFNGRLKIGTADGSIVLTRYAIMNLEIDGKLYTHKIWECDKLPAEMLLGTDFLKGKAIINMIDGSVSFPVVRSDSAFKVDIDSINSLLELKSFLEKQYDNTYDEIMKLIKDEKLLNNEMENLLSKINDLDIKKVVRYWMLRWNERNEREKGLWKGSVLPEHKIVYDGPKIYVKPQRINERSLLIEK